MRIDVLTIFPEFFKGPFDFGIIRRGKQNGLIDIRVHDLRRFTSDRHRTVDDRANSLRGVYDTEEGT